jgi:hypothetical protein
LTWLFSGQRSDEIARLRIGCLRWQHDGAAIAGDSANVLARDAVCLLDVPTHETGTAFTKPVDLILGQAIDAWQAVRPAQPLFTDRRTGELVHLLFAARARSISAAYINNTVIPMLCRKAGVPTAEVRGTITSHRARSTIASQLYNAKEPMTLFELQAWLGHRSPQSTQYYAKISPNTLTRAYHDAGYFAATCAPSRSSSTVTPSPPAPSPRVNRGSATTSATATAATRFRAVSTSDGLRPLRLLHPEDLQHRPAPRGQGQPATHADRHPTYRRRTRRACAVWRRRHRWTLHRVRVSTDSSLLPLASSVWPSITIELTANTADVADDAIVRINAEMARLRGGSRGVGFWRIPHPGYVWFSCRSAAGCRPSQGLRVCFRGSGPWCWP